MSMSAEAESPVSSGCRFQRAQGLVLRLMTLQPVR